jgi:hypothetical protein
MKNTRKNNDEMTRSFRRLPLVLVALISLALCICAPALWADDDNDDEEIPFDEAQLFFELNDTDGDLGIQALIDGDPWKRLKIGDPNERKMLDVKVKGRLRRQGLTELFFESAEPPFDELAPEAFFARFPAGIYEIEGKTLEGEELESEVLLTHVMPAPPAGVTVNDENARPADGHACDEEDPPTVGGDVTVSWAPVTTSHPTIGESNAAIEIIRYQVVAEWEDEDENVFVSSVDLPAPDDPAEPMSVTFPAGFFRPHTEVKFEVLVREASYNQTAVESCPYEYEDAEDGDDDDDD